MTYDELNNEGAAILFMKNVLIKDTLNRKTCNPAKEQIPFNGLLINDRQTALKLASDFTGFFSTTHCLSILLPDFIIFSFQVFTLLSLYETIVTKSMSL